MHEMAKIEGNEIVIRVSVAALEKAMRYSRYGGDFERETGKPLTVTDRHGFARDVVGWMLNEREDGSNLVTDMLDEACKQAVEMGSEYIEEFE